MTTIKIDLPDATVQAARAAGLLTPEAIERLLNEAIKRKQAAEWLLSIADRVSSVGIESLSMDEINAEVKAARQERRQRAGGH
jgi:kynurenine formamidase